MNDTTDSCILCSRDASTVPLIEFAYKGRRWAICSEHLPVLIHDPARLEGVLPGAEGLQPAEHKD